LIGFFSDRKERNECCNLLKTNIYIYIAPTEEKMSGENSVAKIYRTANNVKSFFHSLRVQMNDGGTHERKKK